jgi:hypothetical protein
MEKAKIIEVCPARGQLNLARWIREICSRELRACGNTWSRARGRPGPEPREHAGTRGNVPERAGTEGRAGPAGSRANCVSFARAPRAGPAERAGPQSAGERRRTSARGPGTRGDGAGTHETAGDGITRENQHAGTPVRAGTSDARDQSPYRTWVVRMRFGRDARHRPRQTF